MFTGLVQKTGTVCSVERQGGSGKLSLEASAWNRPLEIGESIAVQGVCLTLTREREGVLFFDLLEETFERTNLGAKRPGDTLNLERALRYGDELGGHIVSGHVDGVGQVTGIEPVGGRDRKVVVASPEALMLEMVPKGSVCCDGVSLTLVDVDVTSFSVHIIPHTLADTSIGKLAVGTPINLETDVLAKYARAAMRGEDGEASLTWEALARLSGSNSDQASWGRGR